MRIIFFNTLHNGDLFFTKEFIRAIVKNNTAHKFYIACRQFYSLYSDIENLEVLERPGDIDFNIKSKDIDMTKQYYIKDGALYINASLAINNGTIEHPHKKYYCNIKLECINKYFSDIIKGVNILEVEPKLKYSDLGSYDFIPNVLDGMKFDDLPPQIKSALAMPSIFYYNLAPLSSPKTSTDDDKNIEVLSQKYPTYTIICAKETTVKIKNVISLYDVDIKETPDGKNLLINAYIASYCPIIISKDTGGALIIFNKYTLTTNFKQYVIMLYSEEGDYNLGKTYGLTFIESIKRLVIKQNKHLIPLNKYNSETLLKEIERIGPIQLPKIPLELSGGEHLGYKSKRRTKKNRRKLVKRQHKKREG